ncbi:MAG: L,D-transpeptidase [Candidatus Aminicenantales bacterium]
MLTKPIKIIFWTAGGIVLALGILIVTGNLIARSWSRGPAAMAGEPSVQTPAGSGAAVKALETKARQISAKMKALGPRGLYIMIDTAANRLRLMKDGKIIKEAVVSCGSGDILKDPKGEKKWIFDTPRGEFSVSAKLVNPTWIKPDWAFYEEGEPLPTYFNDRVDNDTLGDYALGFGNGYFIHGTLYTRLLGRNVTHGCVRVGDADLKEIYQMVPFGAKVYIY